MNVLETLSAGHRKHIQSGNIHGTCIAQLQWNDVLYPETLLPMTAFSSHARGMVQPVRAGICPRLV